MGWVGHDGGHFELRRLNGHDHRTVTPTEYLALYNTKIKKYMTGVQRRDKRTGHHAQLFVSSPSYEWQVLDRQGADFALFNIKARDYLVTSDSVDGDGDIGVLTWLGTK